jgi:hypothetical protein
MSSQASGFMVNFPLEANHATDEQSQAQSSNNV